MGPYCLLKTAERRTDCTVSIFNSLTITQIMRHTSPHALSSAYSRPSAQAQGHCRCPTNPQPRTGVTVLCDRRSGSSGRYRTIPSSPHSPIVLSPSMCPTKTPVRTAAAKVRSKEKCRSSACFTCGAVGLRVKIAFVASLSSVKDYCVACSLVYTSWEGESGL